MCRTRLASELRGENGAYSVIQRERRRSRRFLIRSPLTVRWTDENLEARTETQEVSSSGLSFTLPKGPKSGSAVEILMTFPPQLTQVGSVQIRCRGRIVRTSLGGSDRIEVIATIERFDFMREISAT